MARRISVTPSGRGIHAGFTASGCHEAAYLLGKLRSASQGLFQIEDRDAATPERKIVRVVVNVEYEVD